MDAWVMIRWLSARGSIDDLVGFLKLMLKIALVNSYSFDAAIWFRHFLNLHTKTQSFIRNKSLTSPPNLGLTDNRDANAAKSRRVYEDDGFLNHLHSGIDSFWLIRILLFKSVVRESSTRKLAPCFFASVWVGSLIHNHFFDRPIGYTSSNFTAIMVDVEVPIFLGWIINQRRLSLRQKILNFGWQYHDVKGYMDQKIPGNIGDLS